MKAKEPPLFSIIMPLYNHMAYVEEAVRSVLAQTYPDWELIIVNDGSTDGSEKVAERIAANDGRIRLLHQANAGCSVARITGLRRATGNWLAYLDSDDLWYPTALADFHEYIESHPSVQFIYGYCHRLNANGTVTELLGPSQGQDGSTGPTELFQRMYISHLCVCYRRELLERAGGYDPALPHADDYDLYLRMSQLCSLNPLGKLTGLRRRHRRCLSRPTGFSRMVEGEVLRRFVERRGGGQILDPRIVRKRLGRVYGSAAWQYFTELRFRQALQAARMAHRYRRMFRSTLVAVAARCLLPLARRDAKPLPNMWNGG